MRETPREIFLGHRGGTSRTRFMQNHDWDRFPSPKVTSPATYVHFLSIPYPGHVLWAKRNTEMWKRLGPGMYIAYAKKFGDRALQFGALPSSVKIANSECLYSGLGGIELVRFERKFISSWETFGIITGLFSQLVF